MADASARLLHHREIPLTTGHYELLAAQNATVRLRASSGHIFSFTDLTSAQGAVNFGHRNPAIDLSGLSSDLLSSFYPPAAATYSQWLLKKLSLRSHSVLYRTSEDAVVARVIAMAQRNRPGKVLIIGSSVHARLLASDDPHESSNRSNGASSGSGVIAVEPGTEFRRWNEVSCMFYEPIGTACGFVPLPLPWLRGMSQSAQTAGVTVVADEIQCGFYRFGRLSLAASEYLRPDISLFGNSMTNGTYPLYAAIYPDHPGPVDDANDSAWKPHFETALSGFKAAEAVARYIDSNDVDASVAEVHASLGRACERLAANPRLATFHLAGPTMSFEVRGNRADQLVRACEARGILIGASASRVMIAPPITIPADHLTHALKVLEQAARNI